MFSKYRRRLESLEPRRLLAGFADEPPAVVDADTEVSRDATQIQSEPLAAMEDAMMRLARLEYANLFGRRREGPIICACITSGVIFPFETYISPESANLQFSDRSDQDAPLDDHRLIAHDNNYLYVIRDNELVITSTMTSGGVETVSRVAVPGRPRRLFHFDDRIAVVSEPGTGLANLTLVSVIDVSDRAEPYVVQNFEAEGNLLHSQQFSHRLVIALEPRRTLLPQLKSLREQGVDRWETESEFSQRVLGRLSELINQRLPRFISASGDGQIIRGGPLIHPDRIDGLSTLSELTVFATLDLQSNEPGVETASGVMLLPQLSNREFSFGGSRDGPFRESKFVETPNGFYWITTTSTNVYEREETNIVRMGIDATDGSLDVIARESLPVRLHDTVFASEYGNTLRLGEYSTWADADNNVGGTSVTLYTLEQENDRFSVTQHKLQFDGEASSIHFHKHNLYLVSYGPPVFSPDRPPRETRIGTWDLSDPAAVKWEGQLTLPGIQTYLHFLTENRLLTIGFEPDVAFAYESNAYVGLYEVRGRQLDLLSSLEFEGHSAGTVSERVNSFRWFSDDRVFAFPIRVENGKGWSNGRWVGGERLAFVRIESSDAPLDRIASLETHDHDEVVRHTVGIGNHLYSVSDSGVLVGQSSMTEPIGGTSISGSASEVPSKWRDVSASGLWDDARTFLSDDLGIDTADHFHVGMELRDETVEFLFEVDSSSVLVRRDSAGEFAYSGTNESIESNIHHNFFAAHDTNRDGQVSASDALAIINALHPSEQSSSDAKVPSWFIAPRSGFQLDTNNDGLVSALDALLVINSLSKSFFSNLAGKSIESERIMLVDEAMHDGFGTVHLF